MNLDIVNGLFECLGSIFIWLNVFRLWKDWEIKGVDWKVSLFFTSWGIFNLFFYAKLSLPFSTICAVGLSLGNLIWSIMAFRIVMSSEK